jgi:hypothetical protein
MTICVDTYAPSGESWDWEKATASGQLGLCFADAEHFL